MRRRVYYCGLARPHSLSSLYLLSTLDVTHVIKSPRPLSRFSMSRGSKVARIINAYSGEGLGTRLLYTWVVSKWSDLYNLATTLSGGCQEVVAISYKFHNAQTSKCTYNIIYMYILMFYVYRIYNWIAFS